MERGSLRPVPLRPPGPVAPADAVRHVAAVLPDLDADARRALALVEIAGRSRTEAATELALEREAIAAALQRARKALRRTVFPLAADGWCERAERLLSDRLDGVLEPPGPARLDAHLRHCGRCVEHERRLAQARDGLVRGFIDEHAPEPEPEPEPQAPPVELRVVVHEETEPERAVAAPQPEPAPEPEPEPVAVEPEPIAEPEPAQPPAPVEPAHPKLPVLPEHRSVVWGSLHAIAVLLALVSAILTVLAATGAIERVF